MSTAESRDVIWQLGREVLDRDDLIRWLALPLAGRTPIFATVDEYGNVMQHGVTLQATWRKVMGDTEPAAPGSWQHCSACGSWHVAAVLDPPGAHQWWDVMACDGETSHHCPCFGAGDKCCGCGHADAD